MIERALWLSLVLLALVSAAQAHEVRPAYLEIREEPAQRATVLWKQPAVGALAVRLVPHLSGGALEREPDVFSAAPGFVIARWDHVDLRRPLREQTLAVEGLESTITDVLVVVHALDGRDWQDILKPQRARIALAIGAEAPVAAAYGRLGVEHILGGADHLLFVFGLLLLVDNRWQLLRTVTAFTLAHSITLAATASGLIRVPSALVEALVALSIVVLAVELVHARRGRPALTAQRPELIAFVFGLLHGFAFAGALAEIGLPKQALWLALLLFNVGVEIGQLLFISAASTLLWLLRRWSPPVWTRPLAPYAIGICAATWFIERLVALA